MRPDEATPFPANCLSVVIPAFNAENEIRKAISSAHDCSASKVIVVDDGSADATAQIASSVGATVLQQKNSGAAVARKRGLLEVETPFVVFLDADDTLIPHGINQGITALQQASDLGVVGGLTRTRTRGRTNTLPTLKTLTTKDLLSAPYGPFPSSAAVFRADSIRRASESEPPPLAPRFAEDFELLIRVSMVAGVALVDTQFCDYELRGGKSAMSALRAVEDSERVRHHYANSLGIPIRALTDAQVKQQAQWREFKSLRAQLGNARAVSTVTMHPRRAMPLASYAARTAWARMKNRA